MVQGPAGGLSAEDDLRKMLPAYAACLVEHDRPDVERILARFPDAANDKALGNLDLRDCLYNVEITISNVTLRGALYAELYRRTYRERQPDLHGVSIDWWAVAAGQDKDRANNYVGLRQFAECLVQKHPQESRALMLVPPRSKREEDAVRTMVPDMGACLAAGSEVHLNIELIEALVAEALYRLSAKAAAATATRASN